MQTSVLDSISSHDALLLIDLQRDFCPGGALAIRDGDAVVPAINRIAQRFEHILVTQDWHPAGHISFASTHPGCHPYDRIAVSYGSQALWPDHCIQQSPGADFHPDLDRDLVLGRAELILRKGFRREIDSYSAFFENDRTSPTGLAGYLRERGIERLFFAGLAYDYCVRFSAVDGQAQNFESFVITDACRAVAFEDSVEATRAEFAARGVREVSTAAIEKSSK